MVNRNLDFLLYVDVYYVLWNRQSAQIFLFVDTRVDVLCKPIVVRFVHKRPHLSTASDRLFCLLTLFKASETSVRQWHSFSFDRNRVIGMIVMSKTSHDHFPLFSHFMEEKIQFISKDLNSFGNDQTTESVHNDISVFLVFDKLRLSLLENQFKKSNTLHNWNLSMISKQ